MITLLEAFKLCQIRDDEVVFLTRKGDPIWLPDIYTGKEVRNRMDMRSTKVVAIRPRFSFGEYEGMMFVLPKEK